MERIIRSVFLIGIALLASLPTPVLAQSGGNSGPTLSPRLAERMLSDHYENIARESLKDVLPSDKYKLLIDVRIEDAEQLKNLKNYGAYSPLPGTTSNNPDFSRELVLGELESLEQKRNVLFILDPQYELSLGKDASLKELVTETITGKLKLNITGGVDAINIRNLEITGDKSRMPASVSETPTNHFNWLQFLSWCVAAFAFLGVVFYMFRKWKSDSAPGSTATAVGDAGPVKTLDAKETAASKDDENDKDSQEEETDEDGNVAPPPPAHPVQTAEAPISPSLLILPTSPNATEFVDKVQALVKEYPKLTSEALQAFIDQHPSKIYRVGYLVELLGFEQSLMLFKGVSQKHWKVIGHYMGEYPVSNVNPIDLEEASMLYRYLVARIVEHKGLESDMGVFAIEGYSANDLGTAIEGEDNTFVAQFISGISDAMAQDILNILPVARRADVLTILSTIDKLDPETVNYIETTIQQSISSEGIKPITISNENRIFSSLGNLQAHEEESLFAQMAQSDPGIMFRSKRFRLYPEHLEFIREDILSEELRTYPIEAVAQMLKGMSANAKQVVLQSLTEKKSLVVRDMLSTLDSQPNGPEFAMARRSFLDQLYSKYAQGGTTFIDNIFKTTNSGASNAA